MEVCDNNIEMNQLQTNANDSITDFPANNISNNISFKIKEKRMCRTGDNGRKNLEIMVPFKYRRNFQRILKMPLINCEISLQLEWLATFLVADTVSGQEPTIKITATKLCSTQNFANS